MFTNVVFQDIVITGAMWLFLCFAAWFDAHGTEVPDAVTVPYTILGISASVLHNRLATALVVAAVAIFILVPWRPQFLMTINDYLVKRAYRNAPEQMDSDMKEEADAADAFFEKHGKAVDKCLTWIYYLVPIALIAAAVADKWAENSAFATILSCCSLLVYMRFLKASNEAEETLSEEERENLPMTAFGGADVLVFVGMLGYYGIISWTYGLVITLIGYLVWVLVKKATSKKPIIGAAMLPAVCMLAPVRLIVAMTICQPIIQAFESIAW